MIILFTGGSACGKSSFAENTCMALGGELYYIAAMKPYGEGADAKIERHRRMRATKGFTTFERYTDMGGLEFPTRGTALLECIANLTANEMFDDEGNYHEPYDAVVAGVSELAQKCENLVIITNDVGSDGAEFEGFTAEYITTIGRINRAIAEMSDAVIEMVSGRPVIVKGSFPEKVNELIEKRMHKTGDEKEMLLIVGGEGTGKREYAASLGYGPECFADLEEITATFAGMPEQMMAGVLEGIAEDGSVQVLSHAECLGKHRDKNDENLIMLADALSNFPVVLVNEVGSGVIPLSPEERHGREAAGRLSCLLADRAEKVVRIVAGIPCTLKD